MINKINADIYSEITEQIVALLEEHKASEFKQSWFSRSTREPLSYNIVSGHCYRGINQLLLAISIRKYKYPLNRWLTFKQAEAKGGKIQKGCKTSPVYFVGLIYFDQTTKRNITQQVEAIKARGESIEHLNYYTVGYLKQYRVFNVSCVDGLPDNYYHVANVPPLNNFERDAHADGVIDATGAVIEYHEQDEAFYIPSSDIICMPLPGQFVSKEAFYNVVFHELSHWTGGQHRLNRPINNRFGSKEYSFEELVAELSSAFVSAVLGYSTQITNNAAYIDSWLKAMHEDKRFVFTVASAAQAASDYILGGCATQQPQANTEGVVAA